MTRNPLGMNIMLKLTVLGAVAISVQVLVNKGEVSAGKVPSAPGEETGVCHAAKTDFIGTFLAAARRLGAEIASRESATAPNRAHALIVVGLPGDAEHERLFDETARQWSQWLTGRLGFAPTQIHVLSGSLESKHASTAPATAEAVKREVAAIRRTVAKQDRLWVFFLGHANADERHVWFHIPGPDMHEEQIGNLFESIVCREQVFWITTSVSARFLRPLSADGRIVITATAPDDELNETEFPYALAAVARRCSAKLDTDGDGRVSLLELYGHTVAEVEARFAADSRVPTEHAQLDDNADGVGTERPTAVHSKDEAGPSADGAVAARTFMPLREDKARER